jgi:predicted Fe-Mo cluster-binding NifX family protein
MMKIAVPCVDGTGLRSRISEHFGRSPYFTVYDTDENSVEIVSNSNPHHGPASDGEENDHGHGHVHGHGYAFLSLSEKGVDVLLCRGLGMRAMRLFNDKGVKVFCGVRGSVKDAIDSFNSGELEEAGPQHACHSGHHH